MDSEDRTLELFLKARALKDPAERAAFLDGEDRGDEKLRAEVESLLVHDAEHGSLRRVRFDAVRLDHSAAPPPRIGDYRILEVLGEGGMGVVYKAEQDNPRRVVALKIMRGGLLSPSAQKRFEFEVRVLGHLQHPGIAQIHEAGSFQSDAGPEPYFAMEFVEGKDLLSYATEHRLGIRGRLDLFIHVCDAVHYAHQKAVIHRDLKPSNILVDQRGQPRVLDFGVAKSTDLDLHKSLTLTQTGLIIGTIAYMSPEQAIGDSENVDIRSDVYSLGVVLYELLGDRLPYDLSSRSALDALTAIRDINPIPLSACGRQFQGDLDTIASKALQKEKERRYQSSLDLATDLRRFLRHEPILARPTSTFYQLRKFARRNRVLVGGVAATFLASLVGTAVSIDFARDAGAERLRATDARETAEKEIVDRKRFSDTTLVRNLLAEREQLWPRRPERIPELEQWVRHAEDLLNRTGLHETYLSTLTASVLKRQKLEGILSKDDTTPQWQRADVDEQFRYETLEGLLASLREFPALIREMRARSEFASTIRKRSIDDCSVQWDQATHDIARSGKYRGLELRPQLGLVPIGPDPDSGLWEFWHVETGSLPERDPETRELRLTEGSGLVFVLIPGGSFTMGAVPPTADRPRESPNVDPEAQSDEGPLHEVTLDPFFLSKFEMTQGQWSRFTNENPSSWQASRGEQFTLLTPVDQVSYRDCETVLSRLVLVLPTEAQWEYAARAGTTTIWWTGDDKQGLEQAANLADLAYGEYRIERVVAEKWNDGFSATAPVGSLRANAFGLHDVAGNLWEWCRDWYLPYERPTSPGNAERMPDPEEQRMEHVSRGGGWSRAAIDARSSARRYGTPSSRGYGLGVRPARIIDP